MNAETRGLSWEEAVVWLRNRPDRQQLVLDAYYDDPLTSAAKRYHASDEWREISRLLSGRTGRALDVGAGRGIASYALACEGFEVTALEPDLSGIVGAGAIRSLAAEAALAIRVVSETSERLPFDNREFDVVFARAVLHHTSDLDRACSEIYRVLRPGGLFVAVREHVISRESDLESFLRQHPLHHLYGGEHAFLLDRYLGSLKAAGFSTIDLLSPLKNPINLFPHSKDSLRELVIKRVSVLPFGRSFWRLALGSDGVFAALLWLATLFDNRPGRLYSFVAHKDA
jgi:SAM-dependent methyltransferase